MAEQQNGLSRPSESGSAERLTCIHGRIHYGATNDTPEPDYELDRIDVDNFINALAELALAIARRKNQLD